MRPTGSGGAGVKPPAKKIGVRGSRTRYLIPGRDGNGAGPDLEILPPPPPSPPPSPSPPGWDVIERVKISKK